MTQISVKPPQAGRLIRAQRKNNLKLSKHGPDIAEIRGFLGRSF
ncbi:hypothetical protein [Pacificoceanicola onchidii]|nr:hypothetical protein [Pacificoceanicola onchidii]